MVDLSMDAEKFRQAGGSVTIVSAPAKIDGEQCDALSKTSGISSSGAIRQIESITFSALPDRALNQYAITPGFASLLSSTSLETSVSGIWISRDLSSDTGWLAGSKVSLSDGRTSDVAGVYDFPSDGRDQSLAYAVASPYSYSDLFDECWIDSWPISPQSEQLSYLSVLASPDGIFEMEVPTIRQLNSTLGVKFDGSEKFDKVPFVAVQIFLIAISFSSATIWIWTRRLEFSSALHAGVRRADIILQLIIEFSVLMVPAGLVSAIILYFFSHYSNPDPWISSFCVGLKFIFISALAFLLSIIFTPLFLREDNLFRYFKER
ncbi:ABC transporter permease [Klugiella xanthotipulae]|uniref:ABC transporter permease n=1 Tax=Klugiella xanthotipulae TaxID=244735 RepID=UPI0011526C8E|nr:hypothetical protein [Klugiella xanthotipulae]